MRLAKIVPYFLLVACPLNATDLIQNGSFETNGGANSNVIPGWTIVDEVDGSGTWLVQTGTIGPVTPELTCGAIDVVPPPAGMFAAMATQSSPGSHVLYQEVTIPAGSTPLLSFQFYVKNTSGYTLSDSLSFQTGPNQQFRADIVEPSANPFTANVLQNLQLVGPGNPHEFGYERVTANLTAFAGRRIGIRFVEVDNQACFNVGIDDVRLDTQGGDPATTINRFFALPELVPFAGATTLSWVTENATSVEIDNGVGTVPTSGSRSISLREGANFTLTAKGPAGTMRRPANVAVRGAGPSIGFSATPEFIQQGGSSSLTWRTEDATDVSIDNGIGAVAQSGSILVTPASTTAYTLTATGSGISTSSRATVFVDPGNVPIVSVTSFAPAIIAVAGRGSNTSQFSISNLGKVGTTLTLTQSGDFFTQSPTTFALPAGETQVVTVTTTAQTAGKFEGMSIPSGPGVPGDLSIPVRLLLVTAPTGTVAPTTASARTEIAAPAGQNPSGLVSFTNAGTGTLQGLASADQPWLIPQTDIITIGPGETKAVTFTTNRALRPDAASLAGAAVAILTLSYIDSSSPAIFQAGDASKRGSISVTVVDVVKASASPGGPPPLGNGEVALFLPGLVERAAASADLLLSVRGNSISDLRLYFAAPSTTPVLGNIDQIAPNSGLTLPAVARNVFASTAGEGTVQARSASVARLALSALETDTSSTIGSYITSLPTFRSDRAAVPGDAIFLAGVEKSATRSTNLFVQEVAGLRARVLIDFLDAPGNSIGSQTSDVDAFNLLSLTDVAPANAASIRVTNASDTAARIVAYAVVMDSRTRDAWTIVDSLTQAGRSADQLIGVAPPPAIDSTTNTLYLLNPDTTPLTVTIESRSNFDRRRSVRSSTNATSTSTLTVAPRQTVAVPIGVSNGYLRATAARPFVLTARSAYSAPGRPASFGSVLPVYAAASAIAAGDSRRFGNVDDAARATVAAAAPLTYRSNIGLIETTGQSVVVRLTLRYMFSAGSKTTAQGISSTTVQIPANRFVLVTDLSRTVIGPSRDNYGDLRNMQLDIEVISGSGRVLPLLQTIDNGSGDATIRAQ